MTTNIENRVVSMKFDNGKFKSDARETLSILDRIKAAISRFAASKFGKTGLDSLQNSAKNFSMANVEAAPGRISNAFIAMSTIAITALSNIVNRAVDAGLNIANAFTFEPVLSGLSEYEETLSSTQTVMSATGESVAQVTKTLADLNEYSDQTIYSFSDMTRNIKSFTNAGLSSEKAAFVMKGIANAAAAAGVDAEAASRAMYGFGQSMSLGYVALQDWNQIDNAGLATKEFKNELIDAAVAAGTLTRGVDGVARTNKGTEVTFKNLRNTLQEQWASSDILVDVLSRYSDVSTEVGKKAQKNATNVKTLSQLMDVLKESVQSGWSATFLQIFGNLDEASKLFTALNDNIGGWLSRSAEARNEVLAEWNKLGGRTMVLEGIQNVFEGILSVIKPIGQAFREIFPRKTGEDLVRMSEAFRDFTERLKVGDETAANIKRTFAGVFAVFSIGWQIIKGVASVIGDIIGIFAAGSGGVLEFTGSFGDFLVSVDKALKEGGLLVGMFDAIGAAIVAPIKLIGGFVDALGGISGAAGPLKAFAKDVGEALKEAFAAIGEALSGGNFDDVIKAVQTGLFGGLLVLIRRFIKDGLSIDLSGGVIGNIGETFETLTGSLKAMQTQIQAKTLLTIAGAVGILTLSVIALSKIDSDDLAKSLTGMAVAFGQLLLAMAILIKITGFGAFLRVPAIAAGLILLSTALLILSASVKVLSTLSWNELVKGLAGVSVLLVAISAASVPLSKNAGGMIRAGLAMIPLAIGLRIMASAVAALARLSWGDMVQGLTGLATALGLIVAAMAIMPRGMVMQAGAILILSVALNILASAVKKFSDMNLVSLGKGLLGVAGSLAIIAAAMRLMPKGMVLQAAALVMVATAMAVLSQALAKMGGMSWEEIGKGLTTLGAALLILAVGLSAMSGTLMGSASLLVAAAALAVLTPVLVTLGLMPWDNIVKGLGALAGVFVILGVAGVLLAPTVPVMLGLAAAMLIFGAGLALVGTGIVLAGAGLLAFAYAIKTLISVGKEAFTSFIDSIPMFMEGVVAGLIAFAQAITAAVPAFFDAAVALITTILDAIIQVAPKIGQTFTVLLGTLLRILVTNIPRIANAGLQLVIRLLAVMAANVGKVVNVVTRLIVNFITALGNNTPKIVDAGVKAIIKFINGMAKAIDKNSKQLGEAGGRLGIAIAKGIIKGIGGLAGEVASAARNMAGNAISAVKKKLSIFSPSRVMAEMGSYFGEGFALGIDAMGKTTKTAAENMADGAIDGVKKSFGQIGSLVESDMNLSPTITPVLDLKKIKQDMPTVNNLLGGPTLDTDLSFGMAGDISEGREAQTAAEIARASEPREIKLEQNNYSPKPLSAIEIYRNTKNLTSLLKGALDEE